MLKVVTLIKRRPDLTREQFREYYENNHVPLINSKFGRYFLDYRRNYLIGDEAETGNPDFDVVTECWMKDRETMEACFVVASDPANAAEVAADEEKFTDRSSIRIYVAEEYPLDRPIPG